MILKILIFKKQRKKKKKILSIIEKNECYSQKKFYPEKYLINVESRILGSDVLDFSLNFLFAKKELIELLTLFNKQSKEKKIEIYNKSIEEAKIILNYLINLETIKSYEIENLKQFIIMILQSHIYFEQKFINVDLIDKVLFLVNNINLQKNYLFIMLDNDYNYKNSILYNKNNGNKNPSINLFKYILNNKITIYQSIFNNEQIIILDEIKKGNRSKNKCKSKY